MNLHFSFNNGTAEDDNVKVKIRGMKQKNEVAVRILKPPEKLDNVAIYNELKQIGSPATSKIYDEKFSHQ